MNSRAPFVALAVAFAESLYFEIVPQRREGAPCARDRTRNLVERLINRLEQFRRVATRYEKRVANYLAMLSLAAIILWL